MRTAFALAAIGAAHFVMGDISVSPSSFSGSHAWLEVSWTFPADEPTSDCWIGSWPVQDGNMPNVSAIAALPYPATAPWTANLPTYYFPCTIDPSFGDSSRTGSWKVYEVNSRTDRVLGLFSGGISSPKPLEMSSIVKVEDKAAYLYPKLARTAVETEMQVVFRSSHNTGSPAVKYGLSPTSLTKSASAYTYTYSQSDLCGPSGAGANAGWVDPGYFHQSVMSGLPTDGKTQVYYSIGDDTFGWSKVYSFTATQGVDPTAEVAFIMIADMGVSRPDNTSEHWEEQDAQLTMQGMYNHMKDHPLILHAGDVAYATGIEGKWDLFEQAVENITSATPYMVGLGNHEQDVAWKSVECSNNKDNSLLYYSTSRDSGGENGVPTNARFPMPLDGLTKADPTKMEVYYSFGYGPVTFIMWDTELTCDSTSAQYEWLEATLKGIDRTQTPWVVLFGHRPIYTGNSRDSHLSSIEPLILEYNVSFSAYGHVHNAQLWCPIANGECIREGSPEGQWVGPIHSVIGNAGQSLSKFPKLDNRTVFSLEGHGYTTLKANATNLHVQYYADHGQNMVYEFTTHL